MQPGISPKLSVNTKSGYKVCNSNRVVDRNLAFNKGKLPP